jgi:hypothetical protein
MVDERIDEEQPGWSVGLVDEQADVVETPGKFGHALIVAARQAEHDEAGNGVRNPSSDGQEKRPGWPTSRGRRPVQGKTERSFGLWNIMVILDKLLSVSRGR